VRCDAQQRRALAQRLAHQPKLRGLEIAQAAVDQLAGAARGVRGNGVALDEQHAVAGRRRSLRDAHAMDAAADDNDVGLRDAHAMDAAADDNDVELRAHGAVRRSSSVCSSPIA